MGINVFELKRQYASSLKIPDPASATTQQILEAIDRLPENGMTHPADMRGVLYDALGDGHPERALFAT